VIEDVLETKVGQDYFDYLRFRLSRWLPKAPTAR
jgi:hypothetical protein